MYVGFCVYGPFRPFLPRKKCENAAYTHTHIYTYRLFSFSGGLKPCPGVPKPRILRCFGRLGPRKPHILQGPNRVFGLGVDHFFGRAENLDFQLHLGPKMPGGCVWMGVYGYTQTSYTQNRVHTKPRTHKTAYTQTSYTQTSYTQTSYTQTSCTPPWKRPKRSRGRPEQKRFKIQANPSLESTTFLGGLKI